MNRYFLCIAAAAALLTAACTKPQTDVEEPVIPVTGVTLNPCDTVLLVGATLTLDAAVEPAGATNQTVMWRTSDPNVATVNPAGEVTAIAPGTATITATANDGGFNATCTVTVKEEVIPVTGITISQSAAVLLVGKTLTLGVAVEPTEATNQTVTWNTSDDRIATVNPTGEVTAVAAGTATITATADDGGFTATCTVTVSEPNITMTTKASEVSFRIGIKAGTENSSNLTVDWGDGKKSNITDATRFSESGTFNFTRSYSGASEHHITINGDNMVSFECGNMQLTTLDVSSAIALTILNCLNNQLITLDVSRNTELTVLNCHGNQLTSLDVSRNTALETLEVCRNQITNLKVSANAPLRAICCKNNQLSADALNDLFRSLPVIPEGTWASINYGGTPPIHNPGAHDCDRSIAEKKGWGFDQLHGSIELYIFIL